MTYKLPATIRIGRYDIKLIQEERPFLEDGRACMGYFKSEELVFSVKLGICPQQLADTLFHEILHAIAYERGLVEPAEEEEAVLVFGAGIVQARRDNPGLFAFIDSAFR